MKNKDEDFYSKHIADESGLPSPFVVFFGFFGAIIKAIVNFVKHISFEFPDDKGVSRSEKEYKR